MQGSRRTERRSEAELTAAVEAGTDQLLLRVSAAFGGQRGWANQLRAVAYEMLRFLREDEERARLMVIEVLDAGEEARAIRDRGMLALTELIDLGRAELDDPGSLPRSVAEIAAGVIYNRIHVGVEAGVETLDAELLRELMFSAVLPYLGIEAALAELNAPPPGT
jgi:hypothetical protein